MEAVSETESKVPSLSLAQVTWLATAGLLALGLILRARGYLFGTIPLWEDEAGWTIRLIDRPLLSHTIRPLGFMAVSKVLVSVFSASETVLRAMPWLAGVGALLLSPLLARRLFSSTAARLLFVAVIALHPGAIDLSKEFKPYSVGLFLHLSLLLLALRYLHSRRSRDLAPLLGLLFAGTLFCQDLMFAYPGAFGLLLYEAYRARRARHALAIVLSAVATLGLLASLYVFVWNKAVGGRTTDYWGKKYDVFYVGADGQGTSRLGWTTERVGDFAAMPGMRRELWKPRDLSPALFEHLKSADTTVWQALGLIGVGVLIWRRRYREGALLLSPLAVVLACNALGLWPLGAFRTNLFALLYAAAIAAMALDGAKQARPSLRDWVPLAVLVIAPFLLLGRSSHANKSSMAADSAFPEAMRVAASMQPRHRARAKARLALDGPSCSPWRYYTAYHPDKAEMRQLMRRFDARCIKDFRSMTKFLRRGLTRRGARAFALVSREQRVDDFEGKLPRDLALDALEVVGKRTQFVARVKSSRSRPR